MEPLNFVQFDFSLLFISFLICPDVSVNKTRTFLYISSYMHLNPLKMSEMFSQVNSHIILSSANGPPKTVG
jgi:hypothetical protein